MGHLGVALAARAARPTLPLWASALAAILPDAVDSLAPTPLAPWLAHTTHTLPGAVGWAAAAALLTSRFVGTRRGLLIGLVTLSHVLTDLATSRLNAWPGGPEVGLHLYRFRAADFALEAVVIVGGWLLYRRTLPAPRAWPATVMLAVLLGLQAAFDFGTHIGAGQP
jgi:hypothetical protein